MQKRKPYALRSSRDDPRPEMVDEAIDDVQQALLEESTEKLINTVRHQSARASAICARNKIKALAPKISKNHKAAAQTFVEKDGIYCNDSDISVGTVIKRICLNNYHRYYDVDNSMRNMVKLGANGILDLSKEASIHEGLFSEDEFTRLKKQFKPCLVNDQSVLSKNNEELRKVEQHPFAAISQVYLPHRHRHHRDGYNRQDICSIARNRHA
ncbi:hypothetical protein BX666DRAFT_468505 [Dichotomocladium elegans]|nr:hypothetical protein BX666DRAFT_468505 [Dichotomocladium elegans]